MYIARYHLVCGMPFPCSDMLYIKVFRHGCTSIGILGGGGGEGAKHFD